MHLRSLLYKLAIPVVLLAPLGFVHEPAARTSTVSGGAIGGELSGDDPVSPDRERVWRQLTARAPGTYIAEILAERDSALARWPDRRGAPLSVWVQDARAIADWDEAYPGQVRSAFREWDALSLPVRFTFTRDSARADVHVTFIDHFAEPISGRTKWVRDADWWITDADVVLAVHHRDGDVLDADAMRAMTMHEVGHLLGLDHTRDSSSIMAPRVRVRTLAAADRATARLLYALPAGPVR